MFKIEVRRFDFPRESAEMMGHFGSDPFSFRVDEERFLWRTQYEPRGFVLSREDRAAGLCQCSVCGTAFEAERIRRASHKDKIVACPSCGMSLIIEHVWRMSKYLSDVSLVYQWRRSEIEPGAITCRAVEVIRRFGADGFDAVALLGIKDADERAEFIEENDVAAMTKRELEAAIKERNEAREELAAAREAAENGEKAEKKIEALKKKLSKVAEEKDEALKEGVKELAAQKAQMEALRAEIKEMKEKAGGGSAEDKARIEELEAELEKAGDTSRWEFAAGVKGIQDGFNGLLQLIDRQEEEAKAKYREALRKLLSEMEKLLT